MELNIIFDHRDRINAALWEFLWCLDRTTEERDGVGLVLGGKPMKLSQIVAGIKGSNRETVRRNVEHLEKEGYIRRRRTPYGYVIEVPNYDLWKEKPQNDVSQLQQKPQNEVSELNEKPQNEVSLPQEKHGFATSVPDVPDEPSSAAKPLEFPGIPAGYLFTKELSPASKDLLEFVGFALDRRCLSRGFVTIIEVQALRRPWQRPGVLASKLIERALLWQRKRAAEKRNPALYFWPPGLQRHRDALRRQERARAAA